MTEKEAGYSKEVNTMLMEAWKAALITPGFTTGIFDMMSEFKPISIREIVERKKFDTDKLEKWFYFLENIGIVHRVDYGNQGYILTEKGVYYTPKSPLRDQLGLLGLNEFFMKASLSANETFQTDKSLDKLTEGEITRDYQPKVSDNFSLELYKHFKDYNIGNNDSFLDVGCGNGSFLRSMNQFMPGLSYNGVDMNNHAIEFGKQLNDKQGVSGNINLFTADITKNSEIFYNDSYDWVTGINIFHFIDTKKRNDIVDNMIRVAKKGIIMTQVVVDTAPISAAANPLMALLYNDFTGFFRQKESEELNDIIRNKYTTHQINTIPILYGNNNLVTVFKN